MPSLKDLRNRISSVKATQKITKAMQMVAAAKLRRAQEAAEAARPYAKLMDAVLGELNARVSERKGASPLLVGTGKEDVHLLVVATAERGLCGGFNNSIAKLANSDARRLLAEGKEVKFLCIGRKGYDILKSEHKARIIDVIDMRQVAKINFDVARDISKRLIAMLEQGVFDVATLYFAAFQSVLKQQPTGLQLIPVKLPDKDIDAAPGSVIQAGAVFEYEPDEEEILADLLPRNVSTQIFSALLENAASEQGARMTAMDNATRNAGEMIDRLTLIYNRQRQAQITKELIEIISGAEAV